MEVDGILRWRKVAGPEGLDGERCRYNLFKMEERLSPEPGPLKQEFSINIQVEVGGFLVTDDESGEFRLVPAIEPAWYDVPETSVHLDVTKEQAERFLANRKYAFITGRFEWRVHLRNPYRRQITDILFTEKYDDM